MTLDTRLSHNLHLDTVSQTASRRLSTLRRLAHTQFGSAPRIIHCLFKSCIAPAILYAAPCLAHLLAINASARRQLTRIYAHGARLCLGLHRTTAADTALALANLDPPHLTADARLLLFQPRLNHLHLPDSDSDLPPTHYSPADHLQYTIKLLLLPQATTRRLRLQHRSQTPPSLPTDPKLLRQSIKAFSEYRLLKDWNSSDHGRTLHHLRFNPIRWRYWFKTLDRRSVTSLSRFLSDHFPSRTYLHRFGLINTDICRFCQEAPETPLHLLLNCPNLAIDSDTYQPIFSCPSTTLLLHHQLPHLANQIRKIEEAINQFP